MVIPLRFTPTECEGLPEVSEIAVFPDRLEIQTAGTCHVVRFHEIARWPRPAWLRRLIARIGLRPRWLPVGQRDWFHPPGQRSFRFFTTPPLKVCVPDTEEMSYGTTVFRQVQDVMHQGGYSTWDLG